MLSNYDFIRKSLETNLFFARIMKEHATFIMASLLCKETNLLQQTYYYINSFNQLLGETLKLANGQISQKYINNQVFVTPNTYPAEQIVQQLTGIPIDTSLTQAEIALKGSASTSPSLHNQIYYLNQKALYLTSSIAQFKGMLMQAVSTCNLFTWTFPMMIEHTMHEALFYNAVLQRLQNSLDPLEDSLAVQFESFWDHIMEEHALFIRNYLDPSEKKLFQKAQSYAEEFTRLTKETQAASDNIALLKTITRINKEATVALKDFKEQGTQLILACKIKSLINPLLADHTVREANYYMLALDELQSKL